MPVTIIVNPEASMSRLRSDTFIKPGSESSFDSEDLNSRRYRQELENCDLQMIDMAMAMWPVVTVTIALVFSYFAYDTHSSTSFKPYIAHHIQLAIAYCLCLVLFAMFSLKQQFFVDFLAFCSYYSTLFSHLETSSERKLRIAGFLSSQLSVSLFCLHLSGPLFSWLDTEKKYISTDGTEAI
ncbi:hypothetical protein GCK72_025288 [Caenorhabditis remanei]|uniref:Uncharacterized protein n=1 Tax=Caenorhabditis remanei TaxID=31234 RepID=A0A6A5G229_CAERE|nr:hypothetical protein GCK72_025288 [Caenorhabditis remanei]KAF1748821.1 hypothetical protein GCK72_025288 [Caenorhabditis remanei]